MKDISITITSSAVAWYGAVVATVAAAVSIFNAWCDRAHVVVSGRPNFIELGDETSSEMICLTVANHGRRPVTLRAVALKMCNGKEVASSASMQAQDELGEGKEKGYFINQARFLSNYSFSDVKYVFAVDQTGRTWKGKFNHGEEVERAT